TLQLYKQGGLFQRAGEMGKVLGNAFHSTFKGMPNVVGIRSLGLAAAVELAPIAGSPGKRAYDIFIDCFNNGALVRPAGDVLVIAPPYIVEKSHIDTLVNTLADSIRKNARPSFPRRREFRAFERGAAAPLFTSGSPGSPPPRGRRLSRALPH